MNKPGRWFWPAVAAGYILAGAVVVARVIMTGTVRVEIAPIYAVIRPAFSPWGLIAVPLFVILLVFLKRIIAWRPVVFVTFATVFGALLALAINALRGGLESIPAWAITIFLRDLRNLGELPTFLPVFHEAIKHISDHGHVRPPGLFVFLWLVVKLIGENVYGIEVVIALLGAAAAWPIYALARQFASREASAAAVLLYLLSASFVLHGVSYDGMFGTMGATVICLLFLVARRGGWPETIGAGVALALGVFTSFTFAYVFVLGGLLLLFYGIREKKLPALAVKAAVIAAIPAAFLLLLYLTTGYDFVANFQESYHWAQTQASGGMNVFKLILGSDLPEGYPAPSYRRPYLIWAPGNLYVLLVTAGIPTAVLYLWWTRRLFKRTGWSEAGAFAFGTALLALLIFNFSGVTLGEVERIWLYLLPVITIPAGIKIWEATAAGRRLLLPAALIVIFLQVLIMRVCLNVPW
jgi:hypothetical protein